MNRAPYGPAASEWCPCDVCEHQERCAEGLACRGFELWVNAEELSWRPALGLCTNPSVEIWEGVYGG